MGKRPNCYHARIGIVKMLLLVQDAFVRSIKNALWGIQQLPANVSTICIFKSGNVGDLLCAIPTLECIRNYYPNAKITLFTNGGKSVDATYVFHDYNTTIDHIVVFDRAKTKFLAGIRSIAKQIGNAKYDAIFYLASERANLKNVLRDMILLRMAGKQYTDGFRISTVRVFPKAQAKRIQFMREAERQLSILPLPCVKEVVFRYPISDENKLFVDEYLQRNNLKGKDLLLISMRGKASVNQWPAERFLQVAREWNRGENCVTIAIGGADQQAYITGTLPSSDVMNLAGVFSIAQSIYLISLAKLLLTVDTGTAHMAPIANTNCIVLSSSYYFPEKWMPYGDKVRILRASTSCSPCLKESCPLGTNACINSITVDDVNRTILSLTGHGEGVKWQ